MNIQNKRVREAVSSLILSHPLFAGVLLQQRFEQDDANTKTFSVDGETFRFNGAFADSLSFDECKAVCAHEACHLALLHHTRMGSRDGKTWNEACDYAVNARLVADKFKLPAGALIDTKWADKSAEDIYRALYAAKPPAPKPQPSQAGKPSPKGQSQSPQSGQGQPAQGQGNASGQPSAQGASFGEVLPSKGPNPKAAEAKAKGQIEKAMSIARMAGQLPGGLERAIKAAEVSRFDWREVLHRFFQELTARDYSFTNPNKRFIGSGLVLPSLRSRDMGRIVLAIDTSGSVRPAEVSAMVAEMKSCIETYCENGLAQGLRVLYCDAQMQGDETLFDGDDARPKGGGGTLFSPVFAHLADDLDGAACLVYLTDGAAGDLASVAKLAPSFPVLWGVICDNASFEANPPFGEAFRLDVHA